MKVLQSHQRHIRVLYGIYYVPLSRIILLQMMRICNNIIQKLVLRVILQQNIKATDIVV